VSDRWNGGFCDFRHRTIYLKPSTSATREVLLHEMAHAALGRGGHGARFEAEMLRLKDAGAPVCDSDCRIHRDRAKAQPQSVVIMEAGDAGALSDWDWATVRIHLGYRNGVTDINGKPENRSSALTLRRMWAAFHRGRKERLECARARKAAPR